MSKKLEHPRRPRGSQSGREKGRDESFHVRAKEPLGTSVLFIYPIFLALNKIYRKPFLALLGDRFSYSYFPFNRRSENRAQVTSRASRGKSIEVERRSLVNLY